MCVIIHKDQKNRRAEFGCLLLHDVQIWWDRNSTFNRQFDSSSQGERQIYFPVMTFRYTLQLYTVLKSVAKTSTISHSQICFPFPLGVNIDHNCMGSWCSILSATAATRAAPLLFPSSASTSSALMPLPAVSWPILVFS